MKIRELLERNPVIPAVKDNNTFQAALKSNNEIIFVIMANIMNIKHICFQLKKAKKIVFIHVDMIDGLNSSNFGVDYIINEIKPDGILTTKSNVVAYAHKNNIKVIQRFFVLDTFSYEKTLQNIKENKVIAVEIMPGLMPKIVKKISSQIHQPVITGGLISEKEDIINVLNAGALSVSTTNIKLWDI